MFKRLESEDVVLSAETISTPIWTGDLVTLTEFFTSSQQEEGYSGTYYLDVYNADPSKPVTGSVESGSQITTAKVQFGITYADKDGSGSLDYATGSVTLVGKSPSSTMYGQYRSLVLGDEDSRFVFGSIKRDPVGEEITTGVKENRYFYPITIERSRYKEKLIPGTLSLKLFRNVGTKDNPKFDDPSQFITLTDESTELQSEVFLDSGRVYNLVSGSAGTIYHESGSLASYGEHGSYGYFLPDIGVILLNGEALDDTGSWGINLGTNRFPSVGSGQDIEDTNTKRLYTALNGSGSALGSGSFTVQAAETVTSNYIFVRARNAEFNYSTNPSNITGSGELRHDIMINSPQSFITSVGLYNDNNDLLAVAKLSRPLVKDFTKEALIRVKLDY